MIPALISNNFLDHAGQNLLKYLTLNEDNYSIFSLD